MPTLQELARMRIVHSVPGMDGVPVRKGVVYRTAGDAALEMDVYAPAPGAAPGRSPVVVLIHGGPIPEGTNVKEMGVFVSTGQLLGALGFTVVTFNHRWHGPRHLSDAAEDIGALVARVREDALELGIDPDRVALWAYSGGGPFLGRWLGERPAFLRCVVAYYALLDLQVPPQGVPNELSDETRREYSALRHLAPGDRPVPPLLVVRAGLDHPWLNGAIDRFVQKALEQNVALEVLTHPQGHHGFDVIDDDARSREILRRTVAFLQAHLR
jgi:acetyl esterase/lipase